MNTSTEDPVQDNQDITTPVTDKARQLAEEAIEVAAGHAQGIEREVRGGKDRLGNKVSASQQEVSGQIDETLANVEAYIRREPVKAAGIAFAVGMLAAILIRR